MNLIVKGWINAKDEIQLNKQGLTHHFVNLFHLLINNINNLFYHI
jgi:hypothetical protein